MSHDDAGPRPSQVTIAGWVVAVASAMLVVSVFDAMGNLHSVDMRDQLTKVVTSGSARELGLTVDNATSILRWALFVAAVAASMTGILGIFVLQRHTAARIALTVAAVPVVITAPFAGGFLGAVIGASTAMLWTRPARDWFAGRPAVASERSMSLFSRPEQSRREPDRPSAEKPAQEPAPPSSAPPTPPPPTPPPPTPPPPTPGWGGTPGPPAAPPSYPYVQPPHTGYPPPVPGLGYPVPRPAGQVPSRVRAACLLTWAFSGITVAGSLLMLVVAAIDREEIRTVIRDNASLHAYDEDTVIRALIIGCALFIGWCVASSVLAVFVWRRHTWAWIMLMISIGLAALVTLPAFPVSIVHMAGCGTALGMLLSGPSRAWFRHAGGPGGPGGPPGPGGRGGSPGQWAPPSVYPQAPSPPQPPKDKPPVW
jgi:hypothetical protein